MRLACNTFLKTRSGDKADPKYVKDLEHIACVLDEGVEARMFTATLIIAIALPALMLGHMAHEEVLSQRAYRKARCYRGR